MARGDVTVEVKPKPSWQWKTKCVFSGCNQTSTHKVLAKIDGADNYQATHECCETHIDYMKGIAENGATDEARFRRLIEPQPP